MPIDSQRLERSYEKGEMITVCWEPACPMHMIRIGSEERWVAYPKKADYPRYSHGICRRRARQYMAQIERAERLKGDIAA